MKKLFLSIALVLLMIGSASAAEFDPYVSARFTAFWNTLDPPVGDTEESLRWELAYNTWFGAWYKMNNGVSAHIRLGAKGTEKDNKAYIRLLYGQYDFGSGVLRAGKDYSPCLQWSHQAIKEDQANIGYGALFDKRTSMMKLMLDNGIWITLAETSDRGAGDWSPNQKTPKTFLSYNKKWKDGWDANVGFGYQSLELQDLDDDLNAWVAYARGRKEQGDFRLRWSVHYSQNIGNFGVSFDDTVYNREKLAGAIITADGISDSKNWGGYIEPGIVIDPATLYLGYGYVASKNDEAPETDAQQLFYVACKIPVIKGLFVQPEFNYFDKMEDGYGEDEVTGWSLGAKVQFDL